MNEDLNVVPSISSNWKISQDGLEYIFFLRKDVFFTIINHLKMEKEGGLSPLILYILLIDY